MTENKNKKLTTLVDYFKEYNELAVKFKNDKKEFKSVKIILLSSFTMRGFKEILSVNCWQKKIAPEIYEGAYNQYAQEILDDNSELYKFNPNIVFIFIDIKHLLGEDYFQPYRKKDKERKKIINKKRDEVFSYVNKLKNKINAKIVLSNFEVPPYSPLGPSENKESFGFIESIEKLNFDLRDAYKEDDQVFVFDYNAFCSRIGKENLIDYKMYYLADIKIDPQLLPNLALECMTYIKPITIGSRKCIVLDLDNTLWGGVIGEDGLEGIDLGPTPAGRSFWEFQKYLLSLFEKGIVLAINSKNNLNDVLQVMRKHPYMILKEKHFASMQINWNDKVSNMKTIAKEINIGLDSLVFFDDDQLNRQMMTLELPEVMVVDLPDDYSLYLKTILKIDDFHILKITKEDKIKGKMYAEQRKRGEFKTKATDISGYLTGLGMVMEIQKANQFTIPRIAQLTQKTNQFNLTTRRYQAEDIKNFCDNGDLVMSFSVKDKFGDNGIVGLLIVDCSQNKWRIDTFLLSCRVIGRRIEEIMLEYAIEEAKKNKIKILIGEYIPTKKNLQVKNFYTNNKFVPKGSCDNILMYEHDSENKHNFPNFIKTIII